MGKRWLRRRGHRIPRAQRRRNADCASWRGAPISALALLTAGTQFDVMPTLMDFLGLSAWTEHYLGASLLRFDSPWFNHDSPLSLRVVHELLTSRLRGQQCALRSPR